MSPDEKKESYNANSIKVLDGLEGVRKRFDLIEISRKIKRKGDVLKLSTELRIKPRILSEAIEEGRIKKLMPNIEKSKANILARLKTDREVSLFAEKHDIFKTPTRKLIKLIRGWNLELEKNPFILLTLEEHDLVMGSLLGDACVRQREKNSSFRVAHSAKQRDYIGYKLNTLKNFKISELTKRKRIINGRMVEMISLDTHSHPVFNYYRNLFYKDNVKVVTFDILNQLTPRSLAFWICDDGSYNNKQGYIILCTNAYSFEEHRLMKEFFKQKFGLDPTIGFRDKKYYYLRFKQEDSRKLIEIIRPFIPDCMKYKIGEIKNVARREK